MKKLRKLPQGAILCTIDVVGLYPIIPYSEGLTSLRRFLELRDNKQISTETLIDTCRKQFSKLWRRNLDIISEVHRRHFFNLGTWRRISGKIPQ